jgi:tetratricopeptide (TPR) repeat protein
MKISRTVKKLVGLTLVSVLGLGLLVGSHFLATRPNPAIALYDQGIELYLQGDAEGALKAFDQSIAVYNQESRESGVTGWIDRQMYGAPNKEIAALAYAKKGQLLIVMQKADQAVLAFKKSLDLNPGDNLYDSGSLSDTQQLREEAFVVKYNMELLFKKNPSPAKKEGKGQPKPGEGKPGDQQNPGDQPGNKPGKGNKNDI